MLTFVVAFLKNWEYAQFFMAFTAIFVGFAARACSETPRYIFLEKHSSTILGGFTRSKKVKKREKLFSEWQNGKVIESTQISLQLSKRTW